MFKTSSLPGNYDSHPETKGEKSVMFLWMDGLVNKMWDFKVGEHCWCPIALTLSRWILL